MPLEVKYFPCVKVVMEGGGEQRKKEKIGFAVGSLPIACGTLGRSSGTAFDQQADLRRLRTTYFNNQSNVERKE